MDLGDAGRRLCDAALVAVLIDRPLWWWQGRRWCHLVSDESLDELHASPASAGDPRRGFQGDHYDVPEEHRDRLVAAGAHEVDSRELVRRLALPACGSARRNVGLTRRST